MRIITVTVNPAIDLHLRCERLSVARDNLSAIEGRHTGGKGINVSRALRSYGIDSVAAMILGRENGEQFESEMRQRGISTIAVYTEGYVRENINIHSEGYDTVIATEGPAIGRREIDALESEILKILREGDVVCFSGRISASSDKNCILAFLYSLKRMGAKLVLDSKSLSSDEIRSLSPFMIKPNLEELEDLVGQELLSAEDVVACRHRLASLAEYVLVTLGKDGALLISGSCAYRALAPSVEVESSVGAGDSSIAGFLAAYSGAFDDSRLVQLAVAFGSAACLTKGTLPPEASDVERLYSKILVEKL